MIDLATAGSTWRLPDWPRAWGGAFLCAFAVSMLLTWLLVKIAPAKNWVNVPRDDRWNRRSVAQFGGIPILLACAAGTVFLPFSRQSFILLLLTLAMGMLGLVDDVTFLGPKAKLLGQALLAGMAVRIGIVQNLTNNHWANAGFTVLWIIGITNAMNLLDNMDGLTAGIAMIALLQVLVLGGGSTTLAGLAFAMLGALAAFLFFNFNPARVFMGDVGALSLGFLLACFSVKASAHLSSLSSMLFVPAMVLFIPVVDTLLVSVTRRMNGRPISRGARDHISHRLVLAGLSERQAVALLYAIAAVAGVIAALSKVSWGDWGPGVVALFLIAATLFWLYLAKLQLPPSWLTQPEAGALVVPALLQQFLNQIALM